MITDMTTGLSGRVATINREHATRTIGRLVAGQEERHIGDVLIGPDAFDRESVLDALLHGIGVVWRKLIKDRLEHAVINRARRNRIDPDIEIAQLERDGFDQSNHGMLAGHVVGALCQANQTGNGCRGHDRPATTAFHGLSGIFQSQIDTRHIGLEQRGEDLFWHLVNR